MSTPDDVRYSYDVDFYLGQSEASLRSARKMLSYLFEYYRPASVVDVGCGTGAWLAAALELGVQEIRGIDGDYVDRGLLKIPRESFTAADLEQGVDVEIDADLCISVEVAEHLSIERAASLVRDMTSFAPLVLFGAAIPGQSGVHHVNLQWPSFWAELFEQNEYVAVDCLRIPFWDDPDVDFGMRRIRCFIVIDRAKISVSTYLRCPALIPRRSLSCIRRFTTDTYMTSSTVQREASSGTFVARSSEQLARVWAAERADLNPRLSPREESARRVNKTLSVTVVDGDSFARRAFVWCFYGEWEDGPRFCCMLPADCRLPSKQEARRFKLPFNPAIRTRCQG